MMSLERVNAIVQGVGQHIPKLVIGIFLGRVIGEWLRPDLLVTAFITVGAIILFAIVYRSTTLQETWPLLLLLSYVFYPYPDPYAATLITGATVVAMFFTKVRFIKPILSRIHTTTRVVVAGIIAVGSFLLYLATLAPGILPADSGEFQLVAAKLGVAHPPGFALYTIIANLITRLPLNASPAWEVNFLSAITSALALMFIYLTIERLTKSILAGIVAAIAFGISTTFWSQATTANIRSMTALITTIMFYLLIRIDRSSHEMRNGSMKLGDSNVTKQSMDSQRSHQPERRVPLELLLFFLVLFIGIVHHASLFFIGIIPTFYVIKTKWRSLREPRTIFYLVLAGFLSLLPLLYLPLRGSFDAPGVPNDINTISGFLNHVLALGFRGDFFYYSEPMLLWERLNVILNVLTFQFPVWYLLLMGIGFIRLLISNRYLSLIIFGSFILHTSISAVYRAPQTVEYMLPAYIPLVLFLGVFVGWLDKRRRCFASSGKHSWWFSTAPIVLISALIIFLINSLLTNYQNFSFLHLSTDTRDYTQALFERAPEGALILADWHWVTPMRYRQNVENARPDLDIRYVFPTDEPYIETWTRLIQENLEQGKDVIATRYDEFAYQRLPAAQPIGEAYQFTQSSINNLPSDFDNVSVSLGESIRIIGFRLDKQFVEIGDEAVLTVAMQSMKDIAPGSTLFVHLVGEDGILYAQDDSLLSGQAEDLRFARFRLTPRPGSNVGSHTILVGYSSAQLTQEGESPSRIPLSQLEVIPSTHRPYSEHNTYRPLSDSENNTRLIGYDWDTTITGTTRLYLHWRSDQGYTTETVDLAGKTFPLPEIVGPWGVPISGAELTLNGREHYVPFGQGIIWKGSTPVQGKVINAGQTVKLNQRFAASRPVLRDNIISVRLVGFEQDGFHWAWWDLDDGVPAMGAIPTLKWVGGSEVTDPHWFSVAETAWEGQQVEPLLRIYEAFSQKPVPILDERISSQAPWIPIGRMTVSDTN